MSAPKRILSVQSHVSSGYVGNRAATFPLQVLGWDVDVVNTVQFSNHSGYGRFGGTKSTAEDLQNVFDGLENNGLLRPSRLLTGYIPGSEALVTVARLVKRLRERKDLIYLLDPVMGDDGKMYVAPDVVPIYRDVLLPLATIITPNWFEVELLTDIKITDVQSIQRALTILHRRHNVLHVVISSLSPTPALSLPSSIQPKAVDGDQDNQLLCITSSATRGAMPSIVHAASFSRIKGYFSGVGDLFSALVLAHYNPAEGDAVTAQGELEHEQVAVADENTPLSNAVSVALSTTTSILRATHEYAMSLPEDERQETDDEKDLGDPDRRVRRMRGRELRIVQGIEVIREGRKSIGMKRWPGFWEISG